MKDQGGLLTTVDPLTQDELSSIHEKTLATLRDIGIVIRCVQARENFKAAGATVNGDVVRFDQELLAAAMDRVPSEFSMAGRNRANEVIVGGRHCITTPTYGATHIIDRDGVRRPGLLADVQRFHRVLQDADEIQNVGSNVVEPSDIAPELRHLHVLESLMRNTDKPFMAVSTSRDGAVSSLNMAQQRAHDSVEMARIALGQDFERLPCMVGVATCNSALVWDAPSLGVIRTLASAGQAIMIAPFSIAGSNASNDSAALLVQVNAEVLAGVVYAQLVRPGTPVLYGPYATSRDSDSGNSKAGTPDICLYLLAFGQLARHYGIPYRGGGLITGSKTCDYQAGIESSTLLLVSMLAGSHFLFHTGGWLEGGLTVDFSKLLLDFEELRKVSRLQQGLDLSGISKVYVDLKDHGHGESYENGADVHLGGETKLLHATFSDYSSYDQWIKAGKPTASARATEQSRALWQIEQAGCLLAPERADELRKYVIKQEKTLRR